MRKEAEANADADKQKVELVSTRNEAEQLIYSARKSLTPNLRVEAQYPAPRPLLVIP